MEAEIDEGSRSAAAGPFGWDVVAGWNGDGGEGTGSATRRATLTAIRVLLLLGRRPDAIASWIRDELGVVGILVEGGSEVGRRLGCDRVGRPTILPP